jgi:chemotaxis response regulator CheB
MKGLLHVTTAGGLSLVQKPSEAEHASMPRYAIAHDHVHAALAIDEIGSALVDLARGREVLVEALHPPELVR